LEIIEFLIKLTTCEGQIILDPFMGSGTTAVACRKLQRHFIGFEKDAKMVEIATQRLQEMNFDIVPKAEIEPKLEILPLFEHERTTRRDG
jgi:DNA modification methylase